VGAQDWVLILFIIVLYSAFAAWFGRFSITMPLVLVLAGAVIGPGALGLIDVPFATVDAERIVEITLALLLFADAATLDWNEVRRDAELPARLLLIGLPLTVALGALVAFGLFPAEELGFALLIGAILAPTDAALGLPIFTNPRVPARIRRALNIESGLNDGIATPLVTLFLALAIEEQDTVREGWLPDALTSIGLAVVVGAVVGLIGGWLFATAVARGWTTTTAQHVGNLALALGVYGASLVLGGNGFIAAFVGGLAFGFATRYQLREATEFTEEAGTALSAFVWIMFGAYFVMPLFQFFDARALVFALLALTVVRMVPVAISMIGTGLRPDTVLLMGWLGPRGLASVVFLLIAVEALRESARETTTLAAMAAWTITLSVVLHAITASPLAAWYARRLATALPDSPEFAPHPAESDYHVLGRHRSLGAHAVLAQQHRPGAAP
jgi:NhaP-type Na+/H+ or K+/H+ antiporter